MVRLNRSRLDFLEEFRRMIEEYNLRGVERRSLLRPPHGLHEKLSEEEKRGIAEQLSEEELAIFDLLTKPQVSLTRQEENQVKKVAKDLLESLKREKLVLDWKKFQTTRAAVRVTIETVLDAGFSLRPSTRYANLRTRYRPRHPVRTADIGRRRTLFPKGKPNGVPEGAKRDPLAARPGDAATKSNTLIAAKVARGFESLFLRQNIGPFISAGSAYRSCGQLSV